MKKVHLSFDDGPHATNTSLILNTLKANNIKATFFVLGERVKSNGSMIEKIIADGHRVGNHTWSHKQLTTLSDLDITNEIRNTENLIAKRGPVDYILRPPYGALNTRVNNLLKSLKYNTVLWNVDTEDWKRKPDGWIAFGLEQIGKRVESLVLMHDIHATTAAGLPEFIEKIRMTGAEFVDLESVTGFPAPASGQRARYHTVVAGDTLSSLSRKYYGTPARWKEIYAANSAVIANPNVIKPGMRLLIP